MAKNPDRHYETLDDTPVALSMKFRRPESLTEQVRRLIREEASRAGENAGYESFEEADDFEIEDDYNPRSPHELTIEQELEGYGDRQAARHDRGVAGEKVDAGKGDTEKGGRVEGGREDDKDDDPKSEPDQRVVGRKVDGGKGGEKMK